MKKFFTTVFVAVMATFIFNFSTDSVKAAVPIADKVGTIEDVCTSFNSTNERPVFGYSERDFDLEKNENINIFDLIRLKQKLTNNEDGVTENTVSKLVRYLIGSEDTLDIVEMEHIILDEQSEDMDLTIQNLISHDFTLVNCSPYQLRISENATAPSIKLNFLGIDEYCLESLVTSNICPSADKLESVVTENSWFAIGVIEGKYYLAPIYPREPEGYYYTTTEYPPAYIKYNFADPYFETNNPDPTSILEMLKTQLNSRDYEYTVEKDDFYNTIVYAKTEDSCVTIIAMSVYPFEERETIFKNDYFELFYYNEIGYGITVFETTEEEVYEIGPAIVKYDLVDLENAFISIDQLKEINVEDYEFIINVDSKLATIHGCSDYSCIEILVQTTNENVEGEVILETDEFQIINDIFGIGVILK